MTGQFQLQAYASDLNTSLTDLTAHCKDAANTRNGHMESTPKPLIHPNSPFEAHEARRRVLANITQLQILLTEPAELLQELALKNQILACISWLGEFQVLACIPLQGAVPTKDVAEIIGVPETQLRRIVHLTASTAGFLHEPHPGHVAHSALTAPFVAKPSYLDAAMFLSDIAGPSALHMARATQRFGESDRASESARNIAFNTNTTFTEMCERQSKLQRQWPAYLHHALGGDGDASAEEVAACYDWGSLGNAAVVEIGARSITTALGLAALYPSLRITIQMNSDSTPSSLPTSSLANHTSPSLTNGNSTIFSTPASHAFPNLNGSTSAEASKFQNSHHPPPSLNNHSSLTNGTSTHHHHPSLNNSALFTNGTPSSHSFSLTNNVTISQHPPEVPQPIKDASVYILHFPSSFSFFPTATLSHASASASITAELSLHLPILRANPSSKIFLITGSCALSKIGGGEMAASLRDMTLLQLCNQRSLSVQELGELVRRVRGVSSGGGGGGGEDGEAGGGLVVLGELRTGRGVVVGLEVGYRAAV